MKKQIQCGIIAVVITLFTVSVYAQPDPVQWTRTLQLEGYWEGPVVLTLGGDDFNLTYHTDFKIANGGNALTMDEGFSDPNIGELKGINLIGLNVSDGMIHWFSVDNFGTAHEHLGSWQNNNHFYMEHRSTQDGLPYVEKIYVKLKANNQRVDLKLIATLGSDTVEVLEGTLYRLQSSNKLIPAADEKNVFSIYPNPSEGKVTIECDQLIDELKITNETGQLILKATPHESFYSLQLDQEGIYFFTITSKENTETRKVVLMK